MLFVVAVHRRSSVLRSNNSASYREKIFLGRSRGIDVSVDRSGVEGEVEGGRKGGRGTSTVSRVCVHWVVCHVMLCHSNMRLTFRFSFVFRIDFFFPLDG